MKIGEHICSSCNKPIGREDELVGIGANGHPSCYSYALLAPLGLYARVYHFACWRAPSCPHHCVYDCAGCQEQRCMECDEPATSDVVKTAVRWCPACKLAGKHLGLVP